MLVGPWIEFELQSIKSLFSRWPLTATSWSFSEASTFFELIITIICTTYSDRSNALLRKCSDGYWQRSLSRSVLYFHREGRLSAGNERQTGKGTLQYDPKKLKGRIFLHRVHSWNGCYWYSLPTAVKSWKALRGRASLKILPSWVQQTFFTWLGRKSTDEGYLLQCWKRQFSE